MASPSQASSPADLLALGLGSGEDALAFEESVDLGEFLCGCPELELQGCLGRGGMGVVYRAKQVRLDRDVAVKLMSPEVARDPEFAGRFEREAKAMARLQHPGIVAVHDFGESAGVFYIVMELVDGPNLRQLMEEPIDAEQASEIVGQLCSALAYAHEQGIVHRDIKPENVLLDRSGRVRIADFGLAKLQRTPAGATAHQTRRVLGTPQYMAPEQISDPSCVDHRSDIFAIGVVFYEMLTGQLPVGRFEVPSEFGRCDARLDAVVLRALEARRERRYQTAKDIVDALATTREVETPASADARPSKGRRWLWAAGLAAPIAAAAIAWNASGDDPGPPAAAPVADEDEGETAAPAKAGGLRLDRWPAKELAMLDASAAGVVGIDYSQLRQAPAIARLGAEAFGDEGALPGHCLTDVVNRTHKIVAGMTATGRPVDIIAHADWDVEQLEACLKVAATHLKSGGEELALKWESIAFGSHRRITVTTENHQHALTIGKRDSRAVVTFRDVTIAAMDTLVSGETSEDPFRSPAVRELDFTAPVWMFARPDRSVMPLDIVDFYGTVDVWDRLSVDASVGFETAEAAAAAKTLLESYANVIASIPDAKELPKVAFEQQGERLHGTLRLDVPQLDLGASSKAELSITVRQ